MSRRKNASNSNFLSFSLLICQSIKVYMTTVMQLSKESPDTWMFIFTFLLHLLKAGNCEHILYITAKVINYSMSYKRTNYPWNVNEMSTSYIVLIISLQYFLIIIFYFHNLSSSFLYLYSLFIYLLFIYIHNLFKREYIFLQDAFRNLSTGWKWTFYSDYRFLCSRELFSYHDMTFQVRDRE